jgi:hypothetical protein
MERQRSSGLRAAGMDERHGQRGDRTPAHRDEQVSAQTHLLRGGCGGLPARPGRCDSARRRNARWGTATDAQGGTLYLFRPARGSRFTPIPTGQRTAPYQSCCCIIVGQVAILASRKYGPVLRMAPHPGRRATRMVEVNKVLPLERSLPRFRAAPNAAGHLSDFRHLESVSRVLLGLSPGSSACA